MIRRIRGAYLVRILFNMDLMIVDFVSLSIHCPYEERKKEMRAKEINKLTRSSFPEEVPNSLLLHVKKIPPRTTNDRR